MSESDLSKLESAPVAFVNGQAISMGYFIKSLQQNRQLNVVDDVIRRFVIERLFEEHKISATEDEILDFQMGFREQQQLYDDTATEHWLKKHQMSEDDFWCFCVFETKLALLREKLTSASVEQRFILRKTDLDQVEVYHIVAENEGVAREIIMLVEEGSDFSSLARRTSLDEETKNNGGYMGLLPRKFFGAEAEAAIFSSEPGRVVGPFKGAVGQHLYYIQGFKPAELDVLTRNRLTAQLFEEYISDFMGSAEIRNCWLELAKEHDNS